MHIRNLTEHDKIRLLELSKGYGLYETYLNSKFKKYEELNRLELLIYIYLDMYKYNKFNVLESMTYLKIRADILNILSHIPPKKFKNNLIKYINFQNELLK